jgi:hypothetical protein
MDTTVIELTPYLIFFVFIAFIGMILYAVSKTLDVLEALVDEFLDDKYPEDVYNPIFDSSNDDVFSKERAVKAFSNVNVNKD